MSDNQWQTGSLPASTPVLLLPNNFEMLTPAGLEVQIFVDPKEAKNVTAELKGRKEKEVTSVQMQSSLNCFNPKLIAMTDLKTGQ